MRDAAYETNSATAMRDEAWVVILSDFALRGGEGVQLRRSHFDLENGYLELPADIQKDYPMEDVSPSMATLEIDPYGHFNTTRLLKRYFSSDWWQEQDGDYVFPSRQSERMTTETGRNIIQRLAERAGVSPRSNSQEPTTPEDAHPHALRHSLACYMLRDSDTRLVDVRNRLRHRSIRTTERIYDHFQVR